MEKSLDEIIAGKAPERRERNQRRRKSGRSGSRAGPIKARASDSRGNCVLITNLSPDISEDDLLALFRSAGPITTVSMEKDGRKGVAWVLYEFSADAGVAVGRYHNRSAAGQVIQVRQVERVGDLASGSLKDRLGAANGRSNRKRGGRRERGERGGSKPEKKGPKTQEELDAELDSYMAVENTLDNSGSAKAASTEASAAVNPTPETAPAPVADDLMIE